VILHRALTFLPFLGALVLGPPTVGAPLGQSTGDGEAVQAAEARAPLPLFRFERGPGKEPLLLPRAEILTYRAKVQFGMLDASVGTVIQTSEVEPYRRSVLLQAQEAGPHGGAEKATVSLHAKGDYQLYSLDSRIESHLLPQEWPRVSIHQTSEGTEKRRKETRMGLREGKLSASYRKDTDKNAPKGTRIWREPEFREIPEGTLDMLTAVFMTRALVQDERESLTFPVIDGLRVWEVTLRRGKEKRLRIAAGEFDVIEVLLEPKPWEGDAIDAKKKKKFEGLFGIHGTIHLFVEKHSGVPVKIAGDLPAGPFTLGVEVELAEFEGTPEGFRTVADGE